MTPPCTLHILHVFYRIWWYFLRSIKPALEYFRYNFEWLHPSEYSYVFPITCYSITVTCTHFKYCKIGYFCQCSGISSLCFVKVDLIVMMWFIIWFQRQRKLQNERYLKSFNDSVQGFQAAQRKIAHVEQESVRQSRDSQGYDQVSLGLY